MGSKGLVNITDRSMTDPAKLKKLLDKIITDPNFKFYWTCNDEIMTDDKEHHFSELERQQYLAVKVIVDDCLSIITSMSKSERTEAMGEKNSVYGTLDKMMKRLESMEARSDMKDWEMISGNGSASSSNPFDKFDKIVAENDEETLVVEHTKKTTINVQAEDVVK